MAKITPIDIIKGVSRKFGGGNSKEYFATNKCSYHIHLAKRVNSYVRGLLFLRSSSVHPPFNLRSSSVRAPFELRSSSVQAPFELRSSSVQAPFELRSSSVRAPFNLRSGIGERTKNKGKCNDNTSVLKRRDSEAQKGTNNTEI